MVVPVRRLYGILVSIALLALNVCFAVVYSLWQRLDSDSINRMETISGMDSTVLLPHSNVMWVAAQGSLIAILALDVLTIMFVVKARSSGRRAENVQAMSASHSA
ncbi:hypothetical protein AS038_12545 [Arthrobacter sp. NIO-1057]|nr:hypothetical protein AS038_12545 [Arthrobacter sp. NIO-1057]SCC40947.1 hypothetical protein GA0061084_2556 [Arthrobacter sp. NIO-1057]